MNVYACQSHTILNCIFPNFVLFSSLSPQRSSLFLPLFSVRLYTSNFFSTVRFPTPPRRISGSQYNYNRHLEGGIELLAGSCNQSRVHNTRSFFFVPFSASSSFDCATILQTTDTHIIHVSLLIGKISRPGGAFKTYPLTIAAARSMYRLRCSAGQWPASERARAPWNFSLSRAPVAAFSFLAAQTACVHNYESVCRERSSDVPVDGEIRRACQEFPGLAGTREWLSISWAVCGLKIAFFYYFVYAVALYFIPRINIWRLLENDYDSHSHCRFLWRNVYKINNVFETHRSICFVLMTQISEIRKLATPFI